MRPSEFCLQFVGLKELPNNKFTDSTLIGRLLHAAGQKDGEAYCAYTQEAIFKACASPEKIKELDKLFDASAVKTAKNFTDAAYPIGYKPVAEWLCVWQKFDATGVAQWQGHQGLVIATDGNHFLSFEGNTGGDAREGDGFYVKLRSLNPIKLSGGSELRISCFIQVL